MTDKDLIDRLTERDDEAVRLVSEQYGKLVRMILRRMLDSAEDVEECENDTYIQLWNSIPPERPANLKAFICKVARNMGLKRIGYQTALKRSADMTESYEELEDSIIGRGNDPEKMAEASELGRIISRYLKRKKSDQRVMFVKRYWFYEKPEDIGRQMGVSAGSVNTTLYRMRRELSEELKKNGYTG